MKRRSIGIIGGGLMGCLVAIAMARKGDRVVLFERGLSLLSRASRGNEGKVHLGYTFGLDDARETQQTIFRYGIRFERNLAELLGVPLDGMFLHRRQYYAAHRDSALSSAGMARHFELIERLCRANGLADAGPPVTKLSPAQVRERFHETITEAWEVAEAGIDCNVLGQLVRSSVADAPSLEIVFATTVDRVSDGERPTIFASDGRSLGAFDMVVNAAWDGFPAIESRAGVDLPTYSIRAKSGFITDIVSGRPEKPVTIVYGPFGDIAPLHGASAYISWYPACLMAFTTEIEQGAAWFDSVHAAFDYDMAYAGSVEAFSKIFRDIEFAAQPQQIRSGPILAVGKTDIYDPDSQLHSRNRFGIRRRGNVISVDTGKLTCAPGLAEEVVEMLGAR